MIIPSFALSILLVPFFLASGANAQFACDPPTIVSPSNGDFGDGTFNITVNYPCGDGLIRIMSDLAGEIAVVPSNFLEGGFTYETLRQPFGEQYYYLLHNSDTEEIARSNVVTITVRCGIPSMRIEGSPNGALATRTPVITGYSDCPFVTVLIPDQASITVPVVNTAYRVQAEVIANGPLTITALASSDGQGSDSRPSANLNIVVDSAEPYIPVSSVGNEGKRMLTNSALLLRLSDPLAIFPAEALPRAPS
jgi:hypothetical protein